MDMTVKLQVFEGPLDLLLHLLDKNKVNIYDIPIVEITKQYMDYIREMKRHDLNVVSEFLVMAATLLDIKSKMLLPAPRQYLRAAVLRLSPDNRQRHACQWILCFAAGHRFAVADSSKRHFLRQPPVVQEMQK